MGLFKQLFCFILLLFLFSNYSVCRNRRRMTVDTKAVGVRERDRGRCRCFIAAPEKCSTICQYSLGGKLHLWSPPQPPFPTSAYTSPWTNLHGLPYCSVGHEPTTSPLPRTTPTVMGKPCLCGSFSIPPSGVCTCMLWMDHRSPTSPSMLRNKLQPVNSGEDLTAAELLHSSCLCAGSYAMVSKS